MRMSVLEELKSREREVDFLLGGTRFREDWDWLIQQAERVQELEDHIDHLYDNNVHLKGDYRLQEQNKRYREALEKIKLNVKICGNEEYFPKVVEEIVNEALEKSE